MRDKTGTALADFEPMLTTRLRLWYSKVPDWTVLGGFVRLEELEIAGYGADSLACLRGLARLRSLRLLHFPKLTSLEGLQAMQSLNELSLESPPSYDSSGKYLVIDSLRPVGELRQLQKLTILGVKARDASLEPVTQCAALNDIRIGRGFAKDQYALVAGAFPNARLRLHPRKARLTSA